MKKQAAARHALAMTLLIRKAITSCKNPKIGDKIATTIEATKLPLQKVWSLSMINASVKMTCMEKRMTAAWRQKLISHSKCSYGVRIASKYLR